MKSSPPVITVGSTGGYTATNGACIRLHAERADPVGSCNFVHHHTHDGRALRTLNVVRARFTRESLAARVCSKRLSSDVIDVLTALFILRGILAYVRSDIAVRT